MQHLALIVPAVVLVSGVAHADHSLDKPKNADARARLKAGNALYARAQWKAAAEEYQAGAAIEDAPVFDYNLGQCFRFVGDYQQSLTHYERFMDRGAPTGDVLAAVQGFVAEMRAQLQRTRELPPTAAAAAPEPVTPAPTTAPSAPAARPVAESPSQWRYWGWGLAAAGVVGGGVTAYLAVDAHSASNDAADASRPMSDRVKLDDRAASRKNEALWFGVGSGVALVAGVVTLLVASPAQEQKPQAAWNVGISRNGVSMFGQF